MAGHLEEPDEVVIEPPDDDPAQAGQVPLVFVRRFLNPRRPRTACISMWPRPLTSTRRRWLLGWRGWAPGRSTSGQPDDVSWVVMADPEGNEFCVVSHLGSVGKDPRRRSPGSGRWPRSCSTAWTLRRSPCSGRRYRMACSDGTLRCPFRDNRGSGLLLDLHRVSEPKTASCGCTDGRTFSNDGHSAEVARLRAVGAEPSDIGQGDVRWTVLPTPRRSSSARPHPSLTVATAARPTMPGLLVPQRPRPLRRRGIRSVIP